MLHSREDVTELVRVIKILRSHRDKVRDDGAVERRGTMREARGLLLDEAWRTWAMNSGVLMNGRTYCAKMHLYGVPSGV